jgi:hypothetical protein
MLASVVLRLSQRSISGVPPSGVDSVKQEVRFTDNHLGRSAEVIVGGQVVMVVAAPSWLSLGD